MQQERACCAFLAVEITETPDAIRLGILVPPAAGDSATELGAPFLAGVETTEATTATTANDDTGCGCSPQPRHAMQTSPRPVAPSERPHPASGDRAAGIAAGASAAAAVACGVCCVLPFAFPAVALTVVGGVFAAFAGVYR